MAKRIYTTDWYTPQGLLTLHAGTNVIWGERGNGKTYSIKNIIIDEIKNNNGMFFYMRRRHRHVVRTKMQGLFEDISDVAEEKLGDTIKYSSEKQFYYIKNDTEIQCGYCGAVEDAYYLKGLDFSKVTIILFDEFIDYEYMDDEISKYLNLISTITRNRNNVTIFCLGNSIKNVKYSPYFELFGIDTGKIRAGKRALIKHENGATVACEHTKSKSDKAELYEKRNKYVGFDDNNTVRMILFGENEVDKINTKTIDGIGWNCYRYLVPLYITHMKETFEISICTDKVKLPISFVRRINTQNGEVNKFIKYNLSIDNSVVLTNKNGFVSAISKVNSLVDEKTRARYDLFLKTLDCGRVIYDNEITGTEFIEIIKKLA